MSILLYDLVGIDDRRFSPTCWRTQMALAHKGVAYETVATPFTEIRQIADGQQVTLPVIDDGGKIVGDSWKIAHYLETHYPDRPSLFGGPSGQSLTFFVQNWMNTVSSSMFGLIIFDIHEHLLPKDKAYFRASREKRLGKTLEEAQAGREDRVDLFRKKLDPMRFTLKSQPFLGGDSPIYADYIVFGNLQWARAISPFTLLEQGDPVASWFERCLDLYDGLGRNALGYE